MMFRRLFGRLELAESQLLTCLEMTDDLSITTEGIWIQALQFTLR